MVPGFAKRAGLVVLECAAAVALSAFQKPAVAPADLSVFFDATSTDPKVSSPAMTALTRTWRPAYVPMLLELVRFTIPPAASRPAGAEAGGDARPPGPWQRLIELLERQTGQEFGTDLRRWRQWLWKQSYDPHPEYAAFKAAVYRRIDPRMAEFFTGRSLIRLDEVEWGGVRVNGIPPLVSPKTVPVAGAAYLQDSNVVFGIVIGEEARAYPKRILAWHEMALDRIGGVDLTVVYCTLCGTVIPYESVVDGTKRTFGTSGLLYRSNKLMFDAESLSLWSTLDGGPVIGPLAGSTLRLKALPVVTTTWGEWRRRHPRTTVLSIDTGHTRDYAEGVAYRDYFASDQLMFEVPTADGRLKNKDEVLGLLLPGAGSARKPLAVSAAFLARRPVYETTVEGQSLVFLTSPKGANRVYDAGLQRFKAWDGETHVTDVQGRRWSVTEEALIDEAASVRLPRRTAFRAFWFGWHAQFPETILIK